MREAELRREREGPTDGGGGRSGKKRLTAEDREWIRQAEQFAAGSVIRYKAETTIDQFFQVRADYHARLSEPTRNEIYFAKFLHRLFEIPFMVWGKESGVDEDKFIIKFTTGGKQTEESEEDEGKVAAAAADLCDYSFHTWGAVLDAVRARQDPRASPQSQPAGGG